MALQIYRDLPAHRAVQSPYEYTRSTHTGIFMSAILNYILDQQDMRKAYVIFKIKHQPEASSKWIIIPESVRKDKDTLYDFCLETIEDTYGEVKWLRLERIINN